MRFAHIADTHLGLAAFQVLNPETGANLREELIYENFLASIRQIIALKPDAVVHAGDLFHHVRPKTRAYTTVLAALELLAESGIPFIAIAGNHSMVKTRHTTSPFTVLEYNPADVHLAYRFRYEKVETGDVAFHLIPNMLRAEDYRKAFDKITLSGSSPDILVTHGLATMLSDRRLHSVAEHEIDGTMLSSDFAYIALGHFHGQVQVTENAWYSGSIEFCTYGEINDLKGGLLVDPGRGTCSHIDLSHTPMKDLGRIDCEGLSARDATEQIQALAEEAGKVMRHGMCQVTLSGAGRDVLRGIDRRAIRLAASRLLDLRIRVASGEEAQPVLERETLEGLDYLQEFDTFIAARDLSEGMRAKVRDTGRAVLQRVIQQHREEDHAP